MGVVEVPRLWDVKVFEVPRLWGVWVVEVPRFRDVGVFKFRECGVGLDEVR